MRLEREIQDWIVHLAGNSSKPRESNFSSVLRYDRSPLSQEVKGLVERVGFNGLSPTRHRSVHDACRVLRSLIEPRFRTADTNISETPGQILKPDLVLEDVISGAFIIVELKRSRKAAREFATELLAYANCLLQQNQGSQVFLVLVSTSWAPLEQLAFSELALRHFPVLALEYREEECDEGSPTLWVRTDLLPVASVKPFPVDALLVDTKVFWLPTNWWKWLPGSASWMNRIDHAAASLIREAERGGTSGFVIVWHLPQETPSQSGKKSEVRVFVSMAVRNPCRTQELPQFKDGQEAMDFAWSNDSYELMDDTGVRLLLNLELGENVQCYSPESEGTWGNLRERLEHENAYILRFEGFGEIGDQVSTWRTQKRYALRPVIPDVTVFPSWHPLTWLSALESIIDSGDQEDGDSLAWHAFHRGENLGKFSVCLSGRYKSRHFGLTMAQARFARTWSDFFAKHQGAPNLPIRIDEFGFRCSWADLYTAFNFASNRVATEGTLASLCFILGHYIGSGCGNIDHLVRERHKLRMDGVNLPQKLDLMLNKLESTNQRHLIPTSEMWPPLNPEDRAGW